MTRIARAISRFTKKETDWAFEHAHPAFQNPALTLLLAPRQKDFGRILMIIPRRVGNAPQRNKIRRQIRSIFYEEKLYEYPYDCIAIVRPAAINVPFIELKNIFCNTILKQ